MIPTDEPALAADFPPATYEDWRKLVDGVLKGAPFEKLVGKTYDGLTIEPIYRRARNVAPIAGRPAAAPWQIMQRIDHPDPRLPMRWRSMNSRTAPVDLRSNLPAGRVPEALVSPMPRRKP